MSKTKVWIVEYIFWENSCYWIFSTKEKALEFAKKNRYILDGNHDYWLEEYELDSEKEMPE